MYKRLIGVAVALALGGAVVALSTVPAQAGDRAGATGSATESVLAQPKTDLTITYLASPSSAVVTWSLTCGPEGGTHPDPVGACARLDTVTTDPFQPVPPGTMCLQIWDGPQTAQITGYWIGRPVSASFNRVNSCQIARWDNLVPVLPATKGV